MDYRTIPSRAPSSKAANASSVGAKTVSKPPFKVSTSPAFVAAASKVYKDGREGERERKY